MLKSRMSREVHVRFCERVRAANLGSPCSTRLTNCYADSSTFLNSLLNYFQSVDARIQNSLFNFSFLARLDDFFFVIIFIRIDFYFRFLIRIRVIMWRKYSR